MPGKRNTRRRSIRSLQRADRPLVSIARSVGLAVVVLIALVVAGCSASTVPTSSPPPSADPDTSVAIDPPASSDDPGGIDPAGRVVTPKPGQLDVRPISAQSFSVVVDGRRVVVKVNYTSGVEPCNVLDSIVVERGAGSFEITLREGHGPGGVACIEIAEFKRAIVDLGELAPGTYTISDSTDGATPITVTVT